MEKSTPVSLLKNLEDFGLRFVPVGAEQTSTGRFAPSNSYKLFEKSLTKNFIRKTSVFPYKINIFKEMNLFTFRFGGRSPSNDQNEMETKISRL